MTCAEALSYLEVDSQLWARPVRLRGRGRAIGYRVSNGSFVLSWAPTDGHINPPLLSFFMVTSEWEVVSPEQVLAELAELR